MVNPCLILGYNSLKKLPGSSLQEIPRNVEASLFLIISQHLAKIFDIQKMSDRIDWLYYPKTPWVSPLSHITRVCTTLTISSVGASLGRPNHPSKGFHEVFMNLLGRHSFLNEVLDNRSDFKFLHFANVSHPPLLKALYISNQA